MLLPFVTAYDQHAPRAFQVRALDYLLEPFDRERVTDAFQSHLLRETMNAIEGRLSRAAVEFVILRQDRNRAIGSRGPDRVVSRRFVTAPRLP